MTLPKAQPARSAPHEPQDPNLAVLSRSNHDMRSPLSVILGVLEMLQSSSTLDASERRYLELGRDAANDLLGLADALRLYAAIARGTVCMDIAPAQLFAPLREAVADALADRGIALRATAPDTAVAAPCDLGYLNLAMAALTRHLADRLVEGAAARGGLNLRVALQDRRVRIDLGPDGCSDGAAEPLTVQPGDAAIALFNAVSLVRHMHGEVRFDPAAPALSVELPAAD